MSVEIDMLKAGNAKYASDATEMQSEVDALTKHMNLLSNQNYELSVELEKFIEADEQVRRNLNRRDKVEQIRSKVDSAIMKSIAEVEKRRSPDRRDRGSSHFH